MERLVLAAPLPGVTVLRLPAVYGRRDPQRRFGAIVDALDRGEVRIPGPGAFRWTHGHVDNVAHAIALAAEAEPAGPRVFNVGEAETPSMRERAEAIAARMDRSLTFDKSEPPEAWGLFGVLPNDVVVDSSAIREALGFGEPLDEDARLDDLIAGLRVSRS